MTALDELPLLWEFPAVVPSPPSEPAEPPPDAARCADCHHKIRVPLSLARRIGPKCWRKRCRAAHVTVGRPRSPGHIVGQLDLLQLLERISA